MAPMELLALLLQPHNLFKVFTLKFLSQAPQWGVFLVVAGSHYFSIPPFPSAFLPWLEENLEQWLC